MESYLQKRFIIIWSFHFLKYVKWGHFCGKQTSVSNWNSGESSFSSETFSRSIGESLGRTTDYFDSGHLEFESRSTQLVPELAHVCKLTSRFQPWTTFTSVLLHIIYSLHVERPCNVTNDRPVGGSLAGLALLSIRYCISVCADCFYSLIIIDRP